MSKKESYCVYKITCECDALYIGYTANYKTRVSNHKDILNTKNKTSLQTHMIDKNHKIKSSEIIYSTDNLKKLLYHY